MQQMKVTVSDDSQRVPKMKALIRQAEDELVRKRFLDTEELLRLLYGSLVHCLQDEEVITTRDFDAQAYEGASFEDIVPDKVRRFLERAKSERNYALASDSSVEAVLAHLNLLVDGQPTKGALLLFGEHPKRQVSGADINCLHFHGTEIAKPIPSQQV